MIRCVRVPAVTGAKVWVLDRRVFQQVMMRSGLKRMEDNISFLSSVPLFHNLNKDHLTKVADGMDVVSRLVLFFLFNRWSILRSTSPVKFDGLQRNGPRESTPQPLSLNHCQLSTILQPWVGNPL